MSSLRVQWTRFSLSLLHFFFFKGNINFRMLLFSRGVLRYCYCLRARLVHLPRVNTYFAN